MKKLTQLIVMAMILMMGNTSLPLLALEVSKEEYDAIKTFEELKETNPEEAEKFLNQMLLEKRTPTLLFQSALLAVEQDQFQKAIQVFSEVIDLDPNYAGVFRNRGQLYAAQGDFKKAIEDLIKAIEKDGLDGSTVKILSQGYIQLGNILPAETTLRWAMMYKPDDLELHLALASLLLDQGRFVEAAAIARNSIKLGNENPALWNLMIHSYISLDQFDQALDTIESAKLLSQELSDDLILTLGQLYLQKGMNEEAVIQYLDVQERKPLTKHELISLVESLVNLEDGENALKFSKMLRKIDSGSAHSLFLSAKASELNSNTTMAIALAEKCTTKDPGYGKAFLLLGKLYLEQEELEKALDALKIARAFSDHQIQALRLELELWLKKEDWTEALSVLEVLSQVDAGGNWEGLIHSVSSLLN